MGFSGFRDEAFEFYAGLLGDNSKAYWTKHKATYESAVRDEIVALFAELEPEFGTARIFRPYRDMRFSKDKTPYKTQQGAHTSSGHYLAIDADGLVVAGGLYAPSSEQLAHYRAAVDADSSGKSFAAIIDGLRADDFEIAGEQLKSRPRGVPADHPRLDLLRYRSIYAHQGWPADPWMADGKQVLERVRTALRKMDPLLQWVGDHVAPRAE